MTTLTNDDVREMFQQAIHRLPEEEFKQEITTLQKLHEAYEKYRRQRKAGCLRKWYWEVYDMIHSDEKEIELSLVENAVLHYLGLIRRQITIGSRPVR